MAKRKNGEGNWGVRTINGIQYKYYRKYYDWKQDYQTFYGKTEKEINKKRLEFEEKNKDKHKLNLKDIPNESFYYYCIYWVEKIKPYDGSETKEVTLSGYFETIESRIKNTDLGNTQIASLNTKVFQDYIDEYCIKEKKYSRGTIKRTQSILNQICEYLYLNKYVSENYMSKIVIPAEKNMITKRKEVPFLEESDMSNLYNEFSRVDGNGKKIYGIGSYMVIFIMYTGLRFSECAALKWKDVDLKLKIINITHIVSRIRNKNNKSPHYILVDTKGTKSNTSNRSVPLADIPYSILKELYQNQNDEDYIFSNDGKTFLNNRNVTRTLNTMLKNSNCKVKKCGLHSLRHTFGSYLILKGTDIKTVSELLGHSGIEVTLNIYVHVINQQKAASIQLLNSSESIKENVETNNKQKVNLFKFLQNNGINIIEIEDGMLGYISDNKIIKLPINKSIVIGSTELKNIEIYNEFYNEI